MQRRTLVRTLLGGALAGLLPVSRRGSAQQAGDAPEGPVQVLCSYADDASAYELAWSAMAKATVPQMVYDITQISGLRPNFHVGAGQVGNAAAALGRGPQGLIRVIVYNPTWMQEVLRQTRTDWASYSIIAHEVGHHLQGHTLLAGGSHPTIELQADEFSGFVVARLGGTLAQAQLAMQSFGSVNGSATHPPRQMRLLAIAEGWKRGQGQSGAAASPPDRAADETTAPAASPATACATQLDECALTTRLPVGAACSCQTPVGRLPGVAR